MTHKIGEDWLSVYARNVESATREAERKALLSDDMVELVATELSEINYPWQGPAHHMMPSRRDVYRPQARRVLEAIVAAQEKGT